MAFGAIEFKERLEFDRLAILSMGFARLAMEEGLVLHLGPFAFLAQQGMIRALHLELDDAYGQSFPFLLTESPIRNTSDDLVVPNEVFADEKEWETALLKNMLRIQRLIGSLMAFEEVLEITLLFSEGFADESEYKEIATAVVHLAETVVKHSPNIRDVPPLRFVLTKDR